MVEARAKATSVTVDPSNLSEESIANYQQTQDALSQSIGRLLVSVEAYPDLKANANLRWNICTTADEMVAGSVGNKVFFVMCPTEFTEE